MLWQDMEIFYDEEANHGVTAVRCRARDVKVIEYDNVRLFGDVGEDAGSYDMEVLAVDGSSDLVFAYDNVTGPLRRTSRSAPRMRRGPRPRPWSTPRTPRA